PPAHCASSRSGTHCARRRDSKSCLQALVGIGHLTAELTGHRRRLQLKVVRTRALQTSKGLRGFGDLISMVLPPVASGRGYRHEAWVGLFVVRQSFLWCACFQDVLCLVARKVGYEIGFGAARAQFVTKPECPALHALLECLEVGRQV